MIAAYVPLYLLDCPAFMISVKAMGATIRPAVGHHAYYSVLMEWNE